MHNMCNSKNCVKIFIYYISVSIFFRLFLVRNLLTSSLDRPCFSSDISVLKDWKTSVETEINSYEKTDSREMFE